MCYFSEYLSYNHVINNTQYREQWEEDCFTDEFFDLDGTQDSDEACGYVSYRLFH